MKKKIMLFTTLISICLCFSACGKHGDNIEIYNKSSTIFDNINIEIKEGYFYDRHEKFTVDDNTVAVTIYFTKSKDGNWE